MFARNHLLVLAVVVRVVLGIKLLKHVAFPFEQAIDVFDLVDEPLLSANLLVGLHVWVQPSFQVQS